MKTKDFFAGIKSLAMAVMLLSMLCVTITACGDDEEKVPGPQFDNTKTFVINGKTYNIKSVGYYFNETYGNFDIIFTSSEMDLSHKLTSEPSSPYFKISIPQAKCNMSADLTRSLNTEFAIFYIQIHEGSFADFTTGKIYVHVENNKVRAYMEGTAEKGPTMRLAYDGAAVRSYEQIW